MSINEILSKDEIGALMQALSDGDVETANAPRRFSETDNAMEFDLTAPNSVDAIYVPTLELVEDRFTRLLRLSIYNLLRRHAEVSSSGVQVLTLAEYLSTLPSPCSINMLRVLPQHTNAMMMFESHLVETIVDLFYGGDGEPTRIEGRELTAAETRISHLLMRHVLEDIKKSWSALMPLDFEYLSTETNPQFATAMGASDGEIMIVNVINVLFDGHGGAFHILLPYSMLEPLRMRLLANVQNTNDEGDVPFRKGLLAGIAGIEVEIDATLAEIDLSLDDLLHLNPGDILPVELPGALALRVGGIPVWKGVYGKVGNARAVQIDGQWPRS
jgi:flagellar motor switch protein FliM